jgi:hypothetical protein
MFVRTRREPTVRVITMPARTVAMRAPSGSLHNYGA